MLSLRPLVLLLSLVLAGCNSHSAPAPKAAAFGIFVGQSIDSLSPIPDPGWAENFYWVTPPEPNPIFTSYRVWAMPKSGVCRVIGYSDPFTDEASAAVLLETYGSLVTMLTAKYGTPPTVDDLAGDSVSLLMDGLDNRVLWRSWPGELFSEELLFLGLSIGTRPTPKQIQIQFDLANTDTCERERDDAQRAVERAEAAGKVEMTGL